MTSSYVELHARSAFSFLEGSSVPEELVAGAAALDFPLIAGDSDGGLLCAGHDVRTKAQALDFFADALDIGRDGQSGHYD